MSCDVGSTAFDQSSFNQDWQKISHENNHCGELSALEDFNSNFNVGNDASIDPRMVLSSPSSPASSFDSVYNDQAFDATLGSDDFNYVEFDSPSSPATYYDIQPDPNKPTPLRHVAHSARFLRSHRRSVSEPPDNLPHHQPSHAAPAIGFHRDGHFIGTPVAAGASARPLKSLPRNKYKPHRQPPYSPSRTTRNGTKRYSLRRTQTQPNRQQAPTSAPLPMSTTSTMQPPVPCAAQYEPVCPDQQPKYIHSRVCTPTPVSTPTAEMSGQIDPMLAMMSPVFHSDIVSSQEHQSSSRVSIPVTVDQLQAMIVAAVEKAVKGVGASAAERGVEVTVPEQVGSEEFRTHVPGLTVEGSGLETVEESCEGELVRDRGSEAKH